MHSMGSRRLPTANVIRTFHRRLNRNRASVVAVVFGALIGAGWLVARTLGVEASSFGERLLMAAPWYCEVHDPDGLTLVSRSEEVFGAGGVLQGRTRLEDRATGRVLLDFSYLGVWEFDDPWLTEAIREYDYLHVDDAVFSAEQLAAIEAEFAEPEVSRVHALTEGQLVYGAHQSLYQCHRRDPEGPAWELPPAGSTEEPRIAAAG